MMNSLTSDHHKQVEMLLRLAGDENGLKTGLTPLNKGQSFMVWLCEECKNKGDDDRL
jgi:hypothetical protein